MRNFFVKAWSQWWIVTALWWLCAVWTVAGVKHEKHKCMLTFLANFAIGWPLTLPFAIIGDGSTPIKEGLKPLWFYFRPVLLIAILAALERNLTNSSMYSIGASLKTALHGFNAVLTFFAAALMGVDEVGRSCLLRCKCKQNLLMIPALLLVSAGGTVTALCGKADWNSSGAGVLLQLSSSIAYAVKFSVVKDLFNRIPEEDSNRQNVAKPSKWQIAFVTNPVQGLMALAFLPMFETTWGLPHWRSVLTIAFAATGILLFELRLTELTSPLTVSVLGVLHNIAIVAYFLILGESLDTAQLAGFAVSCVGAFLYAWVKHTKSATKATEQRASEEPLEPLQDVVP